LTVLTKPGPQISSYSGSSLGPIVLLLTVFVVHNGLMHITKYSYCFVVSI